MSLTQLKARVRVARRRRNFARGRVNFWEKRLKQLHDNEVVDFDKVDKARAKRNEWRKKLKDREETVDRLNAKIKQEKRRRRRLSDERWGGSRAVTNEVIDIVNDRARVTSRKRWELFGNPGSDHHRSQKLADAVDFGIAEAHWLKNEIASKLTNGRIKSLADFDSFTITRNGHNYRVQIIAGNHGTGPHLHVGVRRS